MNCKGIHISILTSYGLDFSLVSPGIVIESPGISIE